MANGRVITGYSKPYVALYDANGGTPKYTGAIPLARGVDVTIEAESSDSAVFYADNTAAETVGGQFTGGTVTLTVDGLKDAARKLILGLKTTSTVTVGSNTVQVTEYDDQMDIPYVGIGFIVRYMEDGKTSYVPYILTKAAFNVDGLEAATQEDEIDFQTTELEATIMRDDSAHHAWKKIAEEQSSEADAENVIKAMLGLTVSTTTETKSTKAAND